MLKTGIKPTRHRAVMTLIVPKPLYDMRAEASNSLEDIFRSSARASALMRVDKIATITVKNRVEGSQLKDILLLFYPKVQREEVENQENTPQVFECIVSVPKDWNPKLLLAAVANTIEENGVLCLEHVSSFNEDHYQVNDLHLLFRFATQEVEQKLRTTVGYYAVKGGVFS